MSHKHEVDQRAYVFTERQLREFYSPLLGLRNEIRARSEVRLRVEQTANTVWREECEQRSTNRTSLEEFTQKRGPEFRKIISYGNDEFRRDIYPAYERMIAVFRDGYWLAQPETRAYFAPLVEFVNLWSRALDDSLPSEIIDRIRAEESQLESFYTHLEEIHDQLHAKSKHGTV
jgi:hypothetical protein